MASESWLADYSTGLNGAARTDMGIAFGKKKPTPGCEEVGFGELRLELGEIVIGGRQVFKEDDLTACA